MARIIDCVDDDESIRSLYQEALPLGGYECHVFPDAESFWASLKQKRPDLVVLDIMMPGMDGLELLHRWKESEFASIPILLVSAKDKETDIVRGLNEGACDYLAKPFGIMELLARINANLRKNEAQSLVSFKDLRWNSSAHEITLKGHSLALSLKEYDLLAYFIQNPAKAISKEALLRDVWGVSCEIETRTLDMFISRIRRKIEGSSAHIETIRGLGYAIR